MDAKHSKIIWFLVVALCGGCALERKLEGVELEADLSTVGGDGNVAIINAGKRFGLCRIIAGGVSAIKLTIDPGPFAMTVICGVTPFTNAGLIRDFEFVALAGHEYKMEYELYRCMRLKDETTQVVVSDTCKS